MQRLAQEADLLPVPTAPTANEQVKAQASAPGEGKISIQRFGLEPGDLAAGWQGSSEPCLHDAHQTLENLHLTTVSAF